tara:strand:+ start:156 stop:599 length:444 start_codon:yes stop_codon:yes gene_type:complete
MKVRNAIFIPGNVPSSKNSKIKTKHGIFSSKTVKKYLSNLGIQRYSVSKKQVIGFVRRDNEFMKFQNEFKSLVEKSKGDMIISFHFVRATKHKFDFHNMVQIIADLMVAHDFIEDDNMDHFIPMPFKLKNKWYSYNKNAPGVWIKVS